MRISSAVVSLIRALKPQIKTSHIRTACPDGTQYCGLKSRDTEGYVVPQGDGVLLESLSGECGKNSLIIKRTRQTLEDLKQRVLYNLQS